MGARNVMRLLSAALAQDIPLELSGTLTLLPKANNDVLEIGDGTTSFDVKLFGSAAANFISWDASANDLMFQDNVSLMFGTGNDVEIRWDATDLDILAGADDLVINFGNGTNSFDVKLFGNTATSFLLWDASADALIIDQGAADTRILSLRSSDVATALTTGTNLLDVTTSDYLVAGKFAAATGGAVISALGENAAVTTNLLLESYGGQASTTHSSAGRSLIEVYATQHDGANALSGVAADGNVFGVRCNQGGSDTTVWLIDEDGAPQSIIDHAAFADDKDDVALVRSLDHARAGIGAKGLIRSRWDAFVSSNEDMLIDLGILGCPMPKKPGDERPLINLKRLAQLHSGAIWQLFEDFMELAAALPAEVQARLPERVRTKLLPAA